MSPLFSKTKFKQHLLFCLSFICIGVFANDSIPKQPFSEVCKNADAYMLYSYTDVAYSKSWRNYRRHVSFQNKIVINNKSGVDKFAFLSLSKSTIDDLSTITIKTLKSDGSIVKLDSSLILNRQKKEEQTDLINFPIPGVEAGDTIEIKYTYTHKLKLYELGDFVNLFNAIPSLNTEYTIQTPPNLVIMYKEYNGFPKPQVLVNDTLIYCVFKMKEVKALEGNKYTCLPCELPYLFYSVNNKDDDIRNWKDVYNQEFNYMTQPLSLDYEKKSYYRRWKKRIIDDEKDSSKYYKFELLHNDILKNFAIEEPKEEEFIKSTGYFLKEQRFDPISIRRLYRQLLEDLNIKYWAVFARSKRSGEIDPGYIRKGEFDHIFFAYENGKGFLSFLYPHDVNYKYQINEIPTSLYNTKAVIAQPFLKGKIKAKDKYINYDLEVAEADSVQINLITLPGMNANLNYLNQYIYCDVDIENKNTTFNSSLRISGGLSTDLRSFFSMLDKNQEMNDYYSAFAKFEDDKTALEIDTITNITFKNTAPFLYNFNAKGTIKNSVTFISDNMISITLDKLIRNSKIESEKDSIDLNYYLDYSYSDVSTFNLKFPRDIKVLNLEDFNRSIKNDVGEYFFQINLGSSNDELVIQSCYIITKDFIDKEEYVQLKELNNLVQEVKNFRLLIKVL